MNNLNKINFRLISLLVLILFAKQIYPQYKNDFKINDDTTAKYQNAAKLDVDNEGNFVVVWQDKRNVNTLNPIYDIYCQRFNYKGEPQGNNFKINLHDSAASNPNIAIRKDGSFVVGWKEGVWIGPYIYQSRYFIRIFDKFGSAISDYIPVSDSTFNLSVAAPPAIGIGPLNNIYIGMIMIPGPYGNHHLYLQKMDSLGNKIGNNVLVIDSSVIQIQIQPDISVRNNGSFIFVWNDLRLGSGDIFMQKYNANGQKIGTNIKVNDDPVNPSIVHSEPSISSDSIGNFCITWDDSRESSGSFIDIYCQKYDTAFNLIGSNSKVNQGSPFWERGNASVKKRKDGYFVVGWSDCNANGQGWCPYFRRFSNTNLFIGNQRWVTNYNPSQDKYLEDMTLWSDRIISVWRDWRNGNGDIFCNILSFQNPDSIINNVSINNENVINKYILYQNYPNPFNNSTIIKYQINKNSYIKIILYDILGKEIATLINKKQSSGEYKINFSTDDYNLNSGIYYYKLIVNGEVSKTKKLVILK